MTTDLDTRLAALRPTPHWTHAERTAVLEHVLDQDAHAPIPLVARRSRRRAVLAITGLAAAAAIAIPVLLPTGSPGGADPAAARALRHLAAVAAGGPDLHIGPGQYLHVLLTSHQNPTPGQPTVEGRYESWTDADGRTWQVRDETMEWGDGSHAPIDNDDVTVSSPGQGYGEFRTQQDLEGLPTDPAQLRTYLDEHGENADSTDERIYLGVGTILRGGMAPAELRSAAIQVLAGLSHVTVGDTTTDADGNPVQEFVFADPATRADEEWVMVFDTGTAQITEEREDFEGSVHYVGDISGLAIVDSVPADVRDAATPAN